MRIVAKPDGLVNNLERAIWLTPPFDLAFKLIGLPARPRLRRVSPVDEYSEVWREPNGLQRVSYGVPSAKREMAVCSAEEGPTIPPFPGVDGITYALEIKDGVIWWQALD